MCDFQAYYEYDYLGRRVYKQVKVCVDPGPPAQWVTIEKRRFIWDGWKLLQELDVRDPEAPAIARQYTWGLDLAALMGGAGVSPANLEGAATIGGLLAVHDVTVGQSGADYVYAHDGQGNVGQVVDWTAQTYSTAVMVARYEYDPYGSRTNAAAQGEYAQPFRFGTKYYDGVGQPSDPIGGLYYFGERYYIPKYGRWANQDPIGDVGGANLYGYVGNDPTDRYDPFGQCGESALYATCDTVSSGASTAALAFLPMVCQQDTTTKPQQPKEKRNKRTDEECCKAALDAGLFDLDKKPDEVTVGISICCDGRKLACSRTPTPLPKPNKKAGEKEAWDPQAERIINGCIKLHEQTHFEEITCGADDGSGTPTRPKRDYDTVKEPDKYYTNECLGYCIERACLQAKKAECSSDACRQQVERYRNLLQLQVDKYCVGYGQSCDKVVPKDWDPTKPVPTKPPPLPPSDMP